MTSGLDHADDEPSLGPAASASPEQHRRMAALALELTAATDGEAVLRIAAEGIRGMVGARHVEATRSVAGRTAGTRAPSGPDRIAVPLTSRAGAELGLVEVSGPPDPAGFRDGDAVLVGQAAQLASCVLEGIESLAAERLAREGEERRRRQTRAVEEVGRAITARLDLATVVQLATDAATDLTGAAFGAFFYNVEDERGDAYTLYTISGVPREEFSKFPMPRKTEVFAPTFDGEGTVRSDDITRDRRYGHNAPYSGMPDGHLPVRSYLAVPVITSAGEVAGGMFFGHPEPAVFGEEAQATAESLAAQAAVALVNARLWEAAQRELTARKRAFEERDRVARVLQQSLLPPTLPDVPGFGVGAAYRPGTELVGGDFYDVIPLGGDTWGITLGDVCGHGPEAAAHTALTRHAVRTAAIFEERPERVLAALNEALLRSGDDRFTTALYVRVEPHDDGACLTVASGGHPPPLVRRRDGTVEAAGARGTLLGAFPNPDLEPTTLVLRPGESVVLHTDGLTEARRGGRVLGDGPVRALLADAAHASAQQLADDLVELALGHAGTLDDDIAVVVLRLEDVASDVPHVRAVVPARPESVPGLRREITDFAGSVGAAREDVDRIRLAVSEACTNAVVHAYPEAEEPGSVEVTARVDGDALEVEVADRGRGPVPRADSPGLGLGLPLLRALADEASIATRPGGGTAVRMSFRLDSTAPRGVAQPGSAHRSGR